MEAFGLAVQYLVCHAIFNSKRLEWWISNNRTIHDSNCLLELRLIAKLVMHINTTQKYIKLRMGMNPSQSYYLVLQLHFEEFHLILHDAHVLFACLLRNQ